MGKNVARCTTSPRSLCADLCHPPLPQLSHKNSRNKRLTVDVSKNKAFEGMDLEEEERKVRVACALLLHSLVTPCGAARCNAARCNAPRPFACPAQKAKASKLFEAPKGPERSKIWKALNPDKLYYESRREKEEAADETFVVRRVYCRRPWRRP